MSTATTKPKQQHVRVGVGVLVKDVVSAKDEEGEQPTTRFFAGIRKGSHGAGSLALPGGHLEMMESWEDCAKREVKEEMDLDLVNLHFVHVTNDIMVEEDKHYVTIFISGEFGSPQVPRNMEPHKCEGWNSYSWDELKEIRRRGSPALFGPLVKLIDDEPEGLKQLLSLGSSA